MYEVLKKHAVQNIWCSPTQDNLVILSANRITKREGERISFSCMGSRIELPRQNRFYHVYQVGYAFPEVLGLLGKTPSWIIPEWKRFDEVMSELPVFIDLYNENGVQVPLHLSYYMFTKDKALIFAVDQSSTRFINFKLDQIYLRAYTNAFYNTTGGDALPLNTKSSGRLINTSADILAVQSEVNQLNTLAGEVLCFSNGLLMNAISSATCFVGDIVEYKYDASIKNILEFKVSDLKSFLSTIDHIRKYIIHPSGRSQQIDYVDDVDVYVVRKIPTGSFKGQYVQRNQLSSLRMLTHQDYALSVDLFEKIANSLVENSSLGTLDIRDFYIRLYVRNSGLNRPLTYENQRIFELYKLDNSKIVQALTDTNSNVSVWRAEALEASGYTELMGVPYRNITIGLLEKAYGYNALTRAVAESPLPLSMVNGSEPGVVSLPAGFQNEATVYEYDGDGHLIDFHYRSGQLYYVATSPNARMIEPIVGKGSWLAPAVIGSDLIDIPTDDSYRVYLCYKDENGDPSNNWEDITNTDKYEVSNGKLHWVSQETEQVLMVRTDKSFLAYTLSLNLIAGTLYFDLTEYFGNDLKLMYVPMNDLSLWLNKKKLIKNLDYFVQFPRVHIVNKDYLAQPARETIQEITVRFTGLSENMAMREAEDYGFIEHGFLSNNKAHDIRDDKVLDIVVRGSVKHRSALNFSELHSGISVTNALNGSPYQVKEVVVPLRDHGEEETYALRRKALIIDEEIKAYMSLRLPQPERNAVSAIPSRYKLISPFFAHIANDLSTGQFTESSIDKDLSDNEVLELCKTYEPLLKFDPISEENKVDQRYVVIHPTGLFTPLGVTLPAYRFLQKVVKLYGRGLISLSPHLVIS